MTAAQQFNTQTVAPTKGTQGSVVSPGAATAAPTAAVGTADLTGGAGTPSAVASLSSGATSSGSVASINLSPLVNSPGSAFGGAQGGAFNLGTALQAFNAISAVTAGLQTNSGALTPSISNHRHAQSLARRLGPEFGGAARRVGRLDQAVQAAGLTMQLRNQILLSQIMAASAAANFMSAVAASQTGHQ